MSVSIPDDVIARTAEAIYEAERPSHHATWTIFSRVEGNHDHMMKVARGALEASGLAAEVERLTREHNAVLQAVAFHVKRAEVAEEESDRLTEQCAAYAVYKGQAESRIAELETQASGLAEAGRLAGLEEARDILYERSGATWAVEAICKRIAELSGAGKEA